MIDTSSSQALIDDDTDAVVRDPVTRRIQYVNNKYVNIAQQMVEGADVEASYQWDVDQFGSFNCAL